MQNNESEKSNNTHPDTLNTSENEQDESRPESGGDSQSADRETIVVTVKFRNAGKQYDFDTNGIELKCQDQVVVETSRGRALGIVVRAPRALIDIGRRPHELKKVLRLATEADINMARISRAKEEEAFAFCVERIKKRNLPMNLVKADYLFDGSKILFHFTAENRIDFRELVKDLAHHFHTRIEMRQIGVRDEAKLIGGLGICGRELCCSTFITEFQPVSVKMAKQQGLALNPSKISGQCGRLLCCLGYEYETYCSMARKLPKVGRKVQYEGQEATVSAVNVLAQTVTLRLEGRNIEVPIDVLNRDKNAPAKETKPEPPENTSASGKKTGERKSSAGSDLISAHTKASQAESAREESRQDKTEQKSKASAPDGKKNRSGSRRNRQKQRPPSKQGKGPAQDKNKTPSPAPAANAESTSPPADKADASQEQKNRKRRPPRRRNKRRPTPKPKT